jgi:hypothetical protein
MEKPSLIKALEFIALAQRDAGAPYQTHCSLRSNQAVACDGVLAAGHRIEEAIDACPHTLTLLSALRKCKGVLSVAQLNSGRLSVKAGAFKAFIDCTPDATLNHVEPDPIVGMADNRLRDALAALSPFIAENSPRVIMASALLRSGSALATNGMILVEYWHGLQLPPDIIVPKIFIVALCKTDKKIKGFGCSDTTFTIWFEDDSWLRTQLYKERWPDCDAILNRESKPVAMPEKFFEAVETVFEFVDDNRIRIRNDIVQSHNDANKGATYEVLGLVGNVIFNAKHLKSLSNVIKTIDIVGNNGVSYFYGDNVRVALSQLKD